MSLNIAFIYSAYYPINSGVANASKNLAEALVKNGDDVTFYTIIPFRSKLPVKEDVNGVKVIRIRIIACLLNWITFGNRFLQYRLSALYSAIRIRVSGARYDCVFGHTIYWGGTYAYIIGKINRIPSMALAHGEDVNQLEGNKFKERLTRISLKKLTKVFSTNTDFIQTLSRYSSRQYSLLPNVYIDKNPVDITENTFDSRFRDGRLSLLCIGRLDVYGSERKEIKGISVALDAILKLPQIISLNIAGEGELLEEYREFISRNNLTDRIKLLGKVEFEKLQTIMNNSSALLLPSNIEGLSMVMIEAMSKGLPVIASNVGGARDFIKHDVNGLIINRGDSDALSKNVERLASDINYYKLISRNSLVTYRQSFTESSVSKLFHSYLLKDS